MGGSPPKLGLPNAAMDRVDSDSQSRFGDFEMAAFN